MSAAPAREPSAWGDAQLAASVFAVDPAGLAGVSLRAPIGPVRDRWLAVLRDLLPPSAPIRRLQPNIADNRLLGGLDLTATLQAGRPIAERGVLAEADGGIIVLAMAERLDAGVAARLAAVLDSGAVAIERDGICLRTPARFGVVALDEGIGDDERPPAALLDRFAFHVDLGEVGVRDMIEAAPDRATIEATQLRLRSIAVREETLQALCATAIALGIDSIRPSLLAVRAARIVAALAGRDEVSPEDAALAARLVLAPRATMIPAPAQPEAEASTSDDAADRPPDQAEQDDRSEPESGDPERPLDDIVLAAAQAAIPAGLLVSLQSGNLSRGSSRSGTAGALQHSARRGRPAGVRRGDLKGGVRLNVIETLRAAVPWQGLRRAGLVAGANAERRIIVQREDFRIARLKQRTETTTIFAVDASGSSALNRLAEAKGAVELLLAECYVRRDKVALVAFRGRGAELLLPPTRSLVRAKRCLSSLPGGGGTPLAAGIDAAAAIADGVRRQGATPVLIFMTDGHANVARGGKPGRAQAEQDARAAAGAVRLAGFSALLIDTSPRPQPLAGGLAREMGATYLPLPAAEAAALSRSVRAVQQTGRQATR
jgi:magnesium chelatase subunit D